LDILRDRESADLRAELQGPPPSLTLLTGPAGVGKRRVVRDAIRGLDVVRYWAAPLTDPDHRVLLVERLGSWSDPPEVDSGAKQSPDDRERLPLSASWGRIFDRLQRRAAERRGELRLVLEGFPNLISAHPRVLAELERFFAGVRAAGLPVHVVIAGDDDPVFDRMREEESPLSGWIGRWVRVGPLTYREVGALFPSYPLRDRLLAWSVFGGLARHLEPCDPDVGLATNVRQVVLAADAPLLLEGSEQLQRVLQSVGRYTSVLRSLASGNREWAEVTAGTPDLASGAQLAPYLSKLQKLGLVQGEASLDARPGARSRRYRIADPFVWFWHRFVLAHLSELTDGQGHDVWRKHIRPQLDVYAAELFPIACREYLAHHADPRVPGTGRTLGGLWGDGYDIEPSGTLHTGAALYGRTFWASGRITEAEDEALQEEMRRTRYGFGKEARLRALFSSDGFAQALLRRGARSDLMHLITLEDLYRPHY
jgi:hypothetical protein